MADKVIDVEIRTNTTGIKSLRQELRETTIALQQATDPALIERLQQKAGELKDTMQDVNATIEATAGSATENLAKGLGKATSVGIAGFQGLISAQALFGDESKAVTETLVKLQALAGLSDALNSLGALGDTMTEIRASFVAAATKLGLFTTAKKVDTAVTNAQTVATTGATVATNVLGNAMKALPIIAIIAGLTAIIGAIIYFSSETETAEKANNDFNSSLEKSTALLESQATMSKLRGDKALELLKSEGASEDDLHLKKLDNMAIEKYYRDNAITDQKVAIDEKTKFYKKALQEENYELAKKIQEEIKAHRTKYKDLIRENSTYNTDVQIENNNFNKKQAEDEKANAEKAKQKREENNKKRKADLDAIRKNEIDAINSQKSEEEQALIAIREKYRVQIELATKYGKDTRDLIIAQKNEENQIILKTETEKLKITEDAELKRKETEAKLKADAIAREDAEFLRLQELTLTTADYEKLVLQQKYDAEYLAAEGNAELQIALKKKLEADLNAIDKESATKKIATEQEVQNAKLQMASDAFGALASLIDATAGKDEKSQKKAFQINKAASIGQAIISTYLAANSALASPTNNLFPGQAQIAAGVAIVGGMANVAKISRTQFGSGGGGGGGTPPSAPAPSSTQQPSATPSFNLFGSGGTSNNQNASGVNGGNGQNITVTAVVSETDMTYNQGRVNAMKLSASL